MEFFFFFKGTNGSPHLENPKVKAASYFGYLFEHDVESGFFLQIFGLFSTTLILMW
jgi:hypothetical protein